ncbi:MAG: phosphoribosylglycinamide formyltransferase [Clostridiales bacterium]|nr:phosphoribosylglycinamide formyltransferase [Clostridiales bacterium]MBO4687581.1 phosphoribosylglycinamide formyltransferase [Clostridiales bacterium]
MKIAVFVSGGGTNLQAIIDKIASGEIHDVEIAEVIASNDSAFAIVRATKAGIPTKVISKKVLGDAYDEATLTELNRLGVELVVLAGFLSMLGPKTVAAYSNRIINIHPALIPAFCGKGMYGIRPHEAVLAKGVKVSGATVHFVNENYDEGPIILQKAVDVLQDDTPESLQKRIMVECEQVILPKAIQLIADGKIEVVNNLVRVRP